MDSCSEVYGPQARVGSISCCVVCFWAMYHVQKPRKKFHQGRVQHKYAYVEYRASELRSSCPHKGKDEIFQAPPRLHILNGGCGCIHHCAVSTTKAQGSWE